MAFSSRPDVTSEKELFSLLQVTLRNFSKYHENQLALTPILVKIKDIHTRLQDVSDKEDLSKLQTEYKVVIGAMMAMDKLNLGELQSQLDACIRKQLSTVTSTSERKVSEAASSCVAEIQSSMQILKAYYVENKSIVLACEHDFEEAASAFAEIAIQESAASRFTATSPALHKALPATAPIVKAEEKQSRVLKSGIDLTS